VRDNAASVFVADSYRNTVFSVHMYGVHNTAAKVNDSLNRFTAAELTVVVGEFGSNHIDGNPDEDAITAAAQRFGVGYTPAWSWSGNSSDVQYLPLVTGFDPNRLTSWGQRLFNGANGIAATAKEASLYARTARTGAPVATRAPLILACHEHAISSHAPIQHP
jgi:mannan endo-1,4-beta-mannosidase